MKTLLALALVIALLLLASPVGWQDKAITPPQAPPNAGKYVIECPVIAGKTDPECDFVKRPSGH